MQLSINIKNAMLQAIGDSIDINNASLKLLDNDSNIVCELPFAVPSVQSINAGILTFNTLPESLVTFSGTIASAIIENDNGEVLISFTTGDIDSDADLKFPTLTVYAGSFFGLSGLTLSEL